VHAAANSNDGTFGVDIGGYDMSKFADTYGIRSYRVETPAQLESALEEVFSLDAPRFLDVVVESIADRLPQVFSWLTEVGADPEATGAQVQI
jgi:acetolactate synthase-1/2/3 large subunit